jgi:hypothetical protein
VRQGAWGRELYYAKASYGKTGSREIQNKWGEEEMGRWGDGEMM